MEIKTMAGWHEFAENNSNGSWDKYCKPGDLVDEGVYDYFLDVLPPRSMERGYLQVGEPHSHQMNVATGKVQATYATFQKVRKGVWMYLGNCFAGYTWEAELHFDRISDFLKKTYRIRGAIQDGRPHIFCKDGFKMSVQAGATWYCLPYNGETKTAKQWSEDTGTLYETIIGRYRRGKTPEEILKKKEG